MNSRDAVSRAESQRVPPAQPASESMRLRTALIAPAGPPREFLRRIPLRVAGELLLVPTCRVVMIVAHRERLTITTVDQKTRSFEYRLKDLEARLDPAEFLRLGRGVIVNLSAISRIVGGSGGTNKVIMENGQELRMSRKQSVRLRRVLIELLE